MPSQRRLRFGPYELDERSGELRKHGTRLRLQDKPAAVLLALIERAGEVVTREELRARLWPEDTFVDFDHGLSVAVRKLRVTLCDSADQPRYIETIPRHGYRFLGSVESVAAARGRRMLAVLPFSETTPGKPAGFIAAGLTDEITTQLGRLNPQQLGVIAGASAATYRDTCKPLAQVASELGVEYLLEGSVRRLGGRVRISARLIEAADQTQLWAQIYDREGRDVFGIQVEVAEQIARALTVELLPNQQALMVRTARSSPARDLYLRGRFEWADRTAAGVQRALLQFTLAAGADPSFALSYTGLADCYALLGYYGILPPGDAFGKARAAVERALALDGELAEAHCSLAFIVLQAEWDWERAEIEHRLAIELNANYAPAHHWYGIDLTQVGRFDAAAQALERAQQLAPTDVAIAAHVGRLMYFERRYTEAARELRRALGFDPSYAPAHYFLGLCCVAAGAPEQGIEHLQTALQLAPSHPAALSGLAYAYARARRPFHALEVRDRVKRLAEERYVSPFFIAFASSGLDAGEEVLGALRQALAERSPWMLYLSIDPAFDGLREMPAFRTLIDRCVPGVSHSTA